MKDNTIRIKGPKLFQWQKDVADLLMKPGEGKTVVVKSRRQTGKSTLISSLLCYYSFNFAGSDSFVVSPTMAQAKNIFNQVNDAVSKGSQSLIQKANAQDLELKFVNNSTISFKSAAMGQRLRGYNSNALIALDECAFQPDDILPLVLPWSDWHKANVLMVSSPFVRQGFFYNYFCQGEEGINGITSVDWTDPKYKEEMDKILSPERLEMYRRQLPKNQFLTEYLGQWMDDDGMVFTNFKECIENNSISPNDQLWVGIDWAVGNQDNPDSDDTVVTMINQDRKQVSIQYLNNMTPTAQIEKVASILNTYERQIRKIQPELNSIGSVYTDSIKKKMSKTLASRVFGFDTTNTSKSTIITNLQDAFERMTVRILPDEKQKRQLGYYAMEFNPKTRVITFNAPQGLHDDSVIALALALDAQQNYGGSVCLGFV